MRQPVKASRDPRVRCPERASPGQDWAARIAGWPASETETLVEVIRTLCPHDWLDVVVYRTAALEIIRLASCEDAQADWLRRITAQLDGVGFVEMAEPDRVAALRKLEQSLEFRRLQRTAVRVLYDEPEVWAGCGYEGVEGCSDTGLRAGINDLDWLPEPVVGTSPGVDA